MMSKMCETQASNRATSRFTTDSRGSVSIIFGLLVIPLCLGIGMAVDFSRARALRG